MGTTVMEPGEWGRIYTVERPYGEINDIVRDYWGQIVPSGSLEAQEAINAAHGRYTGSLRLASSYWPSGPWGEPSTAKSPPPTAQERIEDSGPAVLIGLTTLLLPLLIMICRNATGLGNWILSVFAFILLVAGFVNLCFTLIWAFERHDQWHSDGDKRLVLKIGASVLAIQLLFLLLSASAYDAGQGSPRHPANHRVHRVHHIVRDRGGF